MLELWWRICSDEAWTIFNMLSNVVLTHGLERDYATEKVGWWGLLPGKG